jgi:hypothetical protein
MTRLQHGYLYKSFGAWGALSRALMATRWNYQTATSLQTDRFLFRAPEEG